MRFARGCRFAISRNWEYAFWPGPGLERWRRWTDGRVPERFFEVARAAAPRSASPPVMPVSTPFCHAEARRPPVIPRRAAPPVIPRSASDEESPRVCHSFSPYSQLWIPHHAMGAVRNDRRKYVIPRRQPPPVMPRSETTRNLLESATPSRRIPNCGFLTPPWARFGMTGKPAIRIRARREGVSGRDKLSQKWSLGIEPL
jgi:hypothetical protein